MLLTEKQILGVKITRGTSENCRGINANLKDKCSERRNLCGRVWRARSDPFSNIDKSWRYFRIAKRIPGGLDYRSFNHACALGKLTTIRNSAHVR